MIDSIVYIQRKFLKANTSPLGEGLDFLSYIFLVFYTNGTVYRKT